MSSAAHGRSFTPPRRTAMEAGYKFKQLVDMGRALRFHRHLKAHEAWSPERLVAYQRKQFINLLQHAVQRSPFYRELYAGIRIDGATALDQLPTVGKATMMENYDTLVTDRRLKLAELRNHLGQLRGDEYYLGEYRVLSTSGTTGSGGIFAYSRREWSTILANALRWYDYIGVRLRLPKRVRVSAIGADNPIHVSVRMIESSDVGIFAHQRLRVDAHLDDLVDALNGFRPDVLLPYPSIGSLLADEQLKGRLDIRPRVISTHTEGLTEETSRKIEEAWGVKPYNHYGLTEEPTFAAECQHHHGLHVFEDLLIAEVVDDHNRPVPTGQTGRKVLLTNLYNFTQPIIRYEVSDMLTMSPELCSCGRPFPLIAEISGRREDVLYMKGEDSHDIAVPPAVLETTLEAIDGVARYQVLHRREGICVRVVPKEGADRGALSRELSNKIVAALKSLGAKPPPVNTEYVADIERPKTIGGKMKLVKSEVNERPHEL
jgi:phenylacetate-CoA ligase